MFLTGKQKFQIFLCSCYAWATNVYSEVMQSISGYRWNEQQSGLYLRLALRLNIHSE